MPRQTWPPYETVRALIHRHVGRTAVICGGGQSINNHIDECPIDAVYFSVNDHGCRLLKDRKDLEPRRIAYVVACDKIEERARWDIGRHRDDARDKAPWGVPVISRHMWADYRLLFMPAPSGGMTAAWLARLMGCSPIVLLGMDLYHGPTYFDDPKAKSSGHTITDRQHFQRWSTMTKRYPGAYRTLGCHPLLREHCAHYDASAPVENPPTVEKLTEELQGVWCRLSRDTTVSQRPFSTGTVLELCKAEAEKLQRERVAVRVKPGELQ